MLENITPASERRWLQSDQGQNASHGQTRSTTGLLFFDWNNQARHVVKSDRGGLINFAKSDQVKMSSILKIAGAFLQIQTFVWEKKEKSQQAKQFQEYIDTEWAQISAPAKYEWVMFSNAPETISASNYKHTKNLQHMKTSAQCREFLKCFHLRVA